MSLEIELKHLQKKIRQFVTERDWEQFHTPKNLAMALAGEAGEILEIFQWLKDGFDLPIEKREDVADELADVMIYLMQLSSILGIELEVAIKEKMAKNAVKYPIDKVRGSAKKYNEY